MQKIILLHPESGNVIDIIENVRELQIEDRGETGIFALWEGGKLEGVKAQCIVVNAGDFPELTTEKLQEKGELPAPDNLKAADKKGNFPRQTIAGLQKELAQLRAEVQAMKNSAAAGNQPAR